MSKNTNEASQLEYCLAKTFIFALISSFYSIFFTMKRTILFFCLGVFGFIRGSAQQVVPGSLLIQVVPGTNIEALWPQLSRAAAAPITDIRSIAPQWHIYKVSLSPAACEGRDAQIVQQVNRLPEVAIVQWDHKVDERTLTPNDPLWSEQRDMNLIGLTRAWENTTGGLTQAGDTIVVAVLEKGMQKEHPDLWPIYWRNHGEIPDNNVDDDNNGYVDDFLGWDAAAGKGDGNGTGSSHGTSVCGIIGARGNDNFGVTGVNWNVRVLPIVNVALESEIIAAYSYAGEMRRLYNTSNRQKGAFVVVTNASFGIDNARADAYPLWCAVYDSLGKIGVLSVAATANANRDVDMDGDMPTTCNSEFLMTVTNVDANTGKKMLNAGFGAESIDFGSPGSGTYTTINRQVTQGDTIWHGTFGGTSAACPHTSGAIGLIYSVKCSGYVADAITNPVACARRVRDAVFNNLRAEPTLEGITVHEGRLDVDLVIEDIMELCTGVVGELEILDIRPNPVRDRLEMRYQAPDYEDKYILRIFEASGKIMYDETFAPPEFEAKIKYIDMEKWPSGVYFLQFGTGKKFFGKKIVKI